RFSRDWSSDVCSSDLLTSRLQLKNGPWGVSGSLLVRSHLWLLCLSCSTAFCSADYLLRRASSSIEVCQRMDSTPSWQLIRILLEIGRASSREEECNRD